MARASSSKRSWKIWTYDVWGNEKDGYEVNDRFPHGVVDLPENPTDAEIGKMLNREFFSKPQRVNTLAFDGDDMVIYVNRKRDGFPILELNLVPVRGEDGYYEP